MEPAQRRLQEEVVAVRPPPAQSTRRQPRRVVQWRQQRDKTRQMLVMGHAAVDDAAKTALELGAPTYRFKRR